MILDNIQTDGTMKSLEWYKQKYKSLDGKDELVLLPNGAIEVPHWLVMYLVHKEGLRSKKKRILNKMVKKEINKALEHGIIDLQNSQKQESV